MEDETAKIVKKRKQGRPRRQSVPSSINKVKESLWKLYADCKEEQDDTMECSAELGLLNEMLKEDARTIDSTFKRAKNVLVSSQLTSKFDAVLLTNQKS